MPYKLAEILDRSLLVDATRRFRSARETIRTFDRARGA
jgi:hypothetical protein